MEFNHYVNIRAQYVKLMAPFLLQLGRYDEKKTTG
jgi:hypothetical protein